MKLDALLDRLVQELSAAAHEDMTAAAADARSHAEQAAEAELAAIRADGEARLSAAEAVNAGLLEAAETARIEFAAMEAAARAELGRTRSDLEARLAQVEDERAQSLIARDVAGAHLEAQTRRVAELERAVEQETQRASQLTGALETERRRTASLDDDIKAGLRRARDLDEALKAETRRTSELASALDAARQQVRTVEPVSTASEGDRDAMLTLIAEALKSIDRATSPGEILESLIEPLKQDFAAVGIFLAGASAFRGWRGHGFGVSPDISAIVVPRDADSLLTRAAGERTRVSAEAGAHKTIAGLTGSPVVRAVALPVLAQDRVIAVAYAEDPDAARGGSAGAGCRVAAMLIEHAMLRLTARHQPAETHAAGAPVQYSPTRAARRVRIKEPVDVTLDGASSSLVDLSVVGAQVLSPNALRPNRVVKMTLTVGRSSVACKGRVVWARFEQPHGTAASQYRVGVKFTESEPQAIESFLVRHGVAEDSGAYAAEGAKAAL
jgi:hypothetical protein